MGSAVFLVLVIAAFIGSAHYLQHRFLRDLPGKLGVNIVTRDGTGYTYSQSMQGKTLFTIHAARRWSTPNGKWWIALHNVSITLYGKKGDRSDHIYGDEFEYDQKAGLVRATGLVHIDLQAASCGAWRRGGASDKAGKMARPGRIRRCCM